MKIKTVHILWLEISTTSNFEWAILLICGTAMKRWHSTGNSSFRMTFQTPADPVCIP